MNRCRFGFLSIYSSSKQGVRFVCKRVNQIHKQGSMLQKLLVNRDKKKNWHTSILANKPTSKNVFEKVHNPSKRENILNSVFIRNITDVLSTGEVAPEIMGYCIEITGVKISPCCQILNVYWQIPPHYYEASEEITEVLSIKAPKIRSELISRNVIGRVPRIFFVRDISNAQSAALEEALQKIDLGPKDSPEIVPDDSFLKNIYSFKTPKMEKVEEITPEKNIPKKSSCMPQNPTDMKSNVFGLQHDILMDRVIASKKKSKFPTLPTAVISAESFPNDDLFSKIPGTAFQADIDRETLIKQFHIERKVLKSKVHFENKDENPLHFEVEDECDIDIPEENHRGEDFIEEETSDRLK